MQVSLKTLAVALAACSLALSACSQIADQGNAMAGKQKSKPCQACHGATGNSTNPQFPKLAGQYRDYIVRALEEYQSGARKNAIMNGMAANLSAKDREDIAAYFSSQKAALYTPVLSIGPPGP